MDLNLKWQVTLWIIHNAADLIFWLVVVKYILDSVLKNVPTIKSNSGFELICSLVDGAYSGLKGLLPGKSVSPNGQ